MPVVMLMPCAICLIVSNTTWGGELVVITITISPHMPSFVMFYTLCKKVNSALFFPNRWQTPQRQDHFLPLLHPTQCLVPRWFCTVNWGKQKTKIKIKVALWLQTVDRIDICVELSLHPPSSITLYLNTLFKFMHLKKSPQMQIALLSGSINYSWGFV